VLDVLTFGESMASLRAGAPVELGGDLSLSIAGAESNVAIGLARLGHRAAWAGVVGDDRFGLLITRTLRAEGVDVARAGLSPAQTGVILFEERLAGVMSVDYYRSGSAGSTVDVEHVAAAMTAAPRILHVTGITAALSPAARDAVGRAVSLARDAGVLVCLDVNYRSRLWSREVASAVLTPIAAMADILVASDDELDLAVDGASDPVEHLLGIGVRDVVVKRGADGATVTTADGSHSMPAREVTAIDTIGAGDAFVAGYLSAELDGLNAEGRLDRGVTLGAFAVATRGDWEGLPRRGDLGILASASGSAIR
jgi:2-dehydro-3-deoxygluconokinase